MAETGPKKMNWYYDSIIDWMLTNPGQPLSQCAAHVSKSQSWLSQIINTDMFKAALASRRESFNLQHDLQIIDKTQRIAQAGLDAILTTLETKKDKVPISELREVTDSALGRLGYGTKKEPAANTTNVAVQVVVPVSQVDLEEARMALRQVQQNRLTQNPGTPLLELEPATVGGGGESCVPTQEAESWPNSLDSPEK